MGKKGTEKEHRLNGESSLLHTANANSLGGLLVVWATRRLST